MYFYFTTHLKKHTSTTVTVCWKKEQWIAWLMSFHLQAVNRWSNLLFSGDLLFFRGSYTVWSQTSENLDHMGLCVALKTHENKYTQRLLLFLFIHLLTQLLWQNDLLGIISISAFDLSFQRGASHVVPCFCACGSCRGVSVRIQPLSEDSQTVNPPPPAHP